MVLIRATAEAARDSEVNRRIHRCLAERKRRQHAPGARSAVIGGLKAPGSPSAEATPNTSIWRAMIRADPRLGRQLMSDELWVVVIFERLSRWSAFSFPTRSRYQGRAAMSSRALRKVRAQSSGRR